MTSQSTLLIVALFSICPTIGFAQDWEARLRQADSLRDSSKYYRAIQLLINLEEKAKKAAEDSVLAEVYIKVGGIYGRAQSLEDDFGIAYFKLARSIASDNNLPELVAKAQFGMGASYYDLESYDSAISNLTKALAFYTKNDNSILVSYLCSNLGLAYFKKELNEEAYAYFLKALEIQKSIHDTYGIGATYSNLGLISLENEHFEESRYFFQESINNYDRIDYIAGLASSIRWKALAWGATGNYDSAGYYFLTYDSLDHDIFHQEYEGEISNLKFQRDYAIQESELMTNQFRLNLFYILTAILILLSIGLYWFLNQRRKRLKSESNAQIQSLLQQQEVQTAYALLEGQDKERKRIASELHDNLGSILTSLSMFSDALVSKNDTAQIKDIVGKISETSQLANEEVRKISHSLDSGLLNHFGLKTAITQLMEAVEASKDIEIELEVQIEDHLANETGLEIYRIIQELVNNTLKHSSCSKIRLDISHISHEMSIIFHDDGVGFVPAKVERGMGLNNIDNRVNRLGGGLSIESAPGKGSVFIIELPNV